MTIHQERTHPEFVDGCYGCKLTTVKMSAADFTLEREGKDVTGGKGTRQYVKNMYGKARAAGRPDPEPMNAEAAKYAPPRGVFKTKKYVEANNGL